MRGSSVSRSEGDEKSKRSESVALLTAASRGHATARRRPSRTARARAVQSASRRRGSAACTCTSRKEAGRTSPASRGRTLPPPTSGGDAPSTGCVAAASPAPRRAPPPSSASPLPAAAAPPSRAVSPRHICSSARKSDSDCVCCRTPHGTAPRDAVWICSRSAARSVSSGWRSSSRASGGRRTVAATHMPLPPARRSRHVLCVIRDRCHAASNPSAVSNPLSPSTALATALTSFAM